MKPFDCSPTARTTSMVTAEGCGYSRHDGLALTRWREDARSTTPAPTSSFATTRAARSGRQRARPASLRARPTRRSFDVGAATLSRRDHDDVETRRRSRRRDAADSRCAGCEVENRSPRRRTLASRATPRSCSRRRRPIRRTPHSASSSSKRRSTPSLGAIFATRRPSAPTSRATLAASTRVRRRRDRARGDCRSRPTGCASSAAAAISPNAAVRSTTAAPLAGHDGPVLDAIAAIRVPLVLDAGRDLHGRLLHRRRRVDGGRLRGARARGARATARPTACSVQAGELPRRRRCGASAPRRRRLDATSGCAGAILVADPALARHAGRDRGATGAASRRSGASASRVTCRSCWFEVRDADGARARCGSWSERMRSGGASASQTEMVIVSAAARRARRPIGSGAGGDRGAGLAAAELLDKPGGVFLRTTRRSTTAIACCSRAARVSSSTRRRGSTRAAAIVAARPRLRREAPRRRRREQPRRRAARHRCAAPSSSPTTASAASRPRSTSTSSRTSPIELTPAPWINVIANEGFGTLVSESGSGSTWSENAHEFRLTPWSNDPVVDPNTEALYVRDEASGAFWSPTLLPTRGAGYVPRRATASATAVFEHDEDGVESALVVFVAAEARGEVLGADAAQPVGAPRAASASPATSNGCSATNERRPLMHVVTELDAATGAILARNGYNTDFADRIAYFDVDVARRRRRRRVAGVRRSRRFHRRRRQSRAHRPPCAARHLSGRVGAALDPCAALRVAFELDARRNGRVDLSPRRRPRRGRGRRAGARAGAAPTSPGASFDAVRARWRAKLGAVAVRTPSSAVDALANGWLLYQVIGSRLWGRTAFYQSSGAFGFRDQLQDVLALVHAAPELTREHLVSRGVAPVRRRRRRSTGGIRRRARASARAVRTTTSGCPFVLCRYVEATGDAGAARRERRRSSTAGRSPTAKHRATSCRRSRPNRRASTSTACARSGTACATATHGLPLMGTGDWNDGMNLVGAGGQRRKRLAGLLPRSRC